MTEVYTLTEDDLEVSDDDPPCIRAARNPNPAILKAVLNEENRLLGNLPANSRPPQRNHITHNFSANTHISGAVYGVYDSPLVAAINAGLPQNIAILLNAGADPNGIQLCDLDEYSVRFIRGRDPKYNTYSFVMCPPRSKALIPVQPSIALAQTGPLTAGEIVLRRGKFSRFWTEPDLPTLHFRSTPARTALEIAAGTGNIAVFDQVRAAKPDESWWLLNPTPTQLPDPLTHSSLCVSSPIHEAIISGKNEMLQHLLSLGFSPNIQPIAAPTRCLSPHMTAIALSTPSNLEAYSILSRDPRIDLAVRTPVFFIHVLHFATALLDIPLLERLSSNSTTPLGAARTTALGHTLLHVASLPLVDVDINLFSRKIYESIHDVRTLDAGRWTPVNLVRRNPANRGILYSAADERPLPRTPTQEYEVDRKKQEAMILWLLDSGTQDLGATDVYGNTALHYLACAMRVNDDLIGKVRACDGGERIWNESRNELGYSPEDLWVDGKAAKVEQWKDFWMDG